MKNSNLKWTSMIAAIMMFAFMFSCNNAQQEQDSAAGDEENEETIKDTEMRASDYKVTDAEDGPQFLADYMNVKNALVNDNPEKVKEAASSMQNSLENSQLEQEQRNQIKENIKAVAQAKDIESQRQAFAQLSQQLYQVLQNKELTDKTVYWAYCPMALNNEGANWLSYEEQIQNPYMGQRMPKCGSVKETIN